MTKWNKCYSFKGAVCYFGKTIDIIEVSTWAKSPSKAKNNILHRFKKEHNLVPNMKLELYGDLTEEISYYPADGEAIQEPTPVQDSFIQERLFEV